VAIAVIINNTNLDLIKDLSNNIRKFYVLILNTSMCQAKDSINYKTFPESNNALEKVTDMDFMPHKNMV
jgi:hypothetical protein